MAAQSRLRPGRLVLRDHRMGHPAGTAGPDQHPERLRPAGRYARADDRVGSLPRRDHHGGADAGFTRTLQRGAGDRRGGGPGGRHPGNRGRAPGRRSASLSGDLARLNSAARVSADPSAVRYLAQYISFNGHLSVPVLTMHTTGDGLVVPENEQAYASVVQRAGDSRLLRQVFVSRAGHCAFTPAETITAVQALLRRLATGQWDNQALQPESLDAAATGLRPADNIFPNGSQIVATAPAFAAYQPDLYPRPFDLSDLDFPH